MRDDIRHPARWFLCAEPLIHGFALQGGIVIMIMIVIKMTAIKMTAMQKSGFSEREVIMDKKMFWILVGFILILQIPIFLMMH